MEFESCSLPQLCSEETRPNFGFGSSEKDRCACALHFHTLRQSVQRGAGVLKLCLLCAVANCRIDFSQLSTAVLGGRRTGRRSASLYELLQGKVAALCFVLISNLNNLSNMVGQDQPQNVHTLHRYALTVPLLVVFCRDLLSIHGSSFQISVKQSSACGLRDFSCKNATDMVVKKWNHCLIIAEEAAILALTSLFPWSGIWNANLQNVPLCPSCGMGQHFY